MGDLFRGKVMCLLHPLHPLRFCSGLVSQECLGSDGAGTGSGEAWAGLGLVPAPDTSPGAAQGNIEASQKGAGNQSQVRAEAQV